MSVAIPTSGIRAIADSWRFGVGQYSRDEHAEIARAQMAGLTDLYMVGQVAAREAERAARAGKSLPQRSATRDTGATGPRSSSPCDKTPQKSSTAADLNELSELDALLICHAEGRLEPLPVELPELPVDAPPLARLVAEDMALLFGLRLAALDVRPVPVSCRWQAVRLGAHYKAVNRVSQYLVGAGVLRDAGQMPSRGGKRGTKLYAAGSARTAAPPTSGTRSDGAASEVQASAVTVEREQAVGRVPVEPAGESPDESGVIDAVGGAATLDLDGVPAVKGAADATESLHASEGYADKRRPIPEYLVGRALEGAAPGNRNDTGVWLACQLRDNGYSADAALVALLDFGRRVPPGSHPYTDRQAVGTVKSVYRRRPRAPCSHARDLGHNPEDSTVLAKNRNQASLVHSGWQA